MITIPRIGQEVLMGFLGGDPDMPVVVGRVFNAIEQVPYRLPEHETRSTWKSDSSPGSGELHRLARPARRDRRGRRGRDLRCPARHRHHQVARLLHERQCGRAD
jgi:uncharacterized protein involved in type VI secretion and phage assembly